MSDTFVVEAELRSDEGKGASRRLRRLEAKIPAIIYGGEQPPVSLSLIRKDLEKQLESEAFYSAIITVNYDGKEDQAILKDLQRHPAKDYPMHADFLRVQATRRSRYRSQFTSPTKRPAWASSWAVVESSTCSTK